MVETLGRLPDPWWVSWGERQLWFEESGVPKPEDVQQREGVLLTAVASSLRQKLEEIGAQDDAPDKDEGSMMEPTGTRLKEEEICLLEDLLEKTLRYHPEDKISMAEVVQHP
jgi:serine/threonine-protein kinase SRPK3